MGPQADTGSPDLAQAPDTPEVLTVPLGRRVEIVGDLLLPAEPTASSRAACTDVAHRLDDWEGPGTFVLCGRLTAARCDPGRATETDGAPTGVSSTSADALGAHRVLTEALRAFAEREDSHVVAVVAPTERDPALERALAAHGARVRTGVDLVCETGTGRRTVLVRTGTQRLDEVSAAEAGPSDERPWLTGMERLEDPRAARRFVTSRLLYRRFRRFLWVPPLVLVAIALLLRVDFVIDALSHIFRSPRQQHALNRAYAATWFSRTVVTVVIAAVILLVLAVVVAVTSRGIWRALGGGGLPRPWARGTLGAPPVAHEQLALAGRDALDVTREALDEGASGVVVAGALVPELTHLDTGFFACPGASAEVVREHRGRLGLPPTFLHHRQQSTIEIETGADLHVRLNLAEADLPLATLGERLATADRVV
ncbi:MAG TPA: hypothetical protein VMU09_05865, partial [Acidimicrobiales bacterium]|nr:hypothetical protein [Acidimicrobiales bacterium]